tara:strand:- start:8934 stop:9344 length:411 start_codon:yes stop_codon:yes gene_type:complete
MNIEWFHEVKKVWGQEIGLVNDGYCGKLLVLDEDAESSYHYHPKKKETFYCIEGYATLTIEGKDYKMAPFLRAKTIFPNERHKFRGDTSAVILEISTHHDDSDVVRLSESKKAVIQVINTNHDDSEPVKEKINNCG